MNPLTVHPLKLILLVLLPLAADAAPPPYWPVYPPSPYYYPPAPIHQPAASAPAEEAARATTVELTAEPAENSPSDVETAPLPLPNEESASDAGSYEAAVSSEAAVSNDNTEDALLAQEIAGAIQQGNFAEAYYLWRPRAEAGNADAQYGIGWMYHNGYGLAIDDDEAVAWWQLASRQGHIDATFALGMLYGLGEGDVRRDMKLAVSYYHQAAREGHEDARLLLRTLIAEGDSHARQLMQTLLEEERVKELTSPAQITSPKANVRKGPGTKYKVLITLKQEHALMPLKREGRWLLLGIKGKEFTGWVHDSLVGGEILTE